MDGVVGGGTAYMYCLDVVEEHGKRNSVVNSVVESLMEDEKVIRRTGNWGSDKARPGGKL